MTTYTRGPWNFEEWSYNEGKRKEYAIIGNKTRLGGLEIGEDDNPFTINEQDGLANARLISCAPELLEALERLMAYDFGNSEGAIQARNIIKKARGES